jgi:hypothetical protein
MSRALISIDCWIVCEEHKEAACSNGYERLVSVLKGAFGEPAVKDLRTREQFTVSVTDRIASKRGGKLLIVGHRADLRKIKKNMLRELAATEGLEILELQFTTAASGSGLTEVGEVSNSHVPYCSIRELSDSLSRATLDHFTSQDKINELVEAYHSEVQRSILDPLLPLAVLVDGFLGVRPGNTTEWFRPGIEAALESLPVTGKSVATEAYWADLAESRLPVERIREMLTRTRGTSYGFPAVLMLARGLGWAVQEPNPSDPSMGAGAIYSRACEVVKTAWDMLNSERAVHLGDEESEMRAIVETTSVGFYVLAAAILDWGSHPVMRKRSELCHTAVDNGFAPLFWPNQWEATKQVLTGEACSETLSRTRERVDRWPVVRGDVERNLMAFEENYTPFEDGLKVLRKRMTSEEWAELVKWHRARVRDVLRIDSFVARVRSAISGFETGLKAVRDGKLSVEGLGQLHAEMVDAYYLS